MASRGHPDGFAPNLPLPSEKVTLQLLLTNSPLANLRLLPQIWKKVALRSPGTKVHVEILSSEFLKFQRVFEGLSNVGFGPRARAIFMSSSLTLTQESFEFAISDGVTM